MLSFLIGGGEDVQPGVELQEMESVEVEEEISERETRRLRREQEKEVKRLQREANLRRKVIGNGSIFLSVEGSSDAGMFFSSALCNEKEDIFLANWISWALLDCYWLTDGWLFLETSHSLMDGLLFILCSIHQSIDWLIGWLIDWFIIPCY